MPSPENKALELMSSRHGDGVGEHHASFAVHRQGAGPPLEMPVPRLCTGPAEPTKPLCRGGNLWEEWEWGGGNAGGSLPERREMISAVRLLMGALPLSFGPGGRTNRLVVRTLDPFFSRAPGERIATELGPIELDMRHQPQRFMAYCYFNLRRHYASSPLGRYIRQVQPGSTFVDVGANLGFYSLLAREAGLHAICFEPEPQFAAHLQRNSSIFGQVFPIALADQRGSLPLYYTRKNAGETSLVPKRWSSRSDATVPVETFSNLALDGALGDPAGIRLVKIDVEGAEEATVRGMTEFLSAGHRPDIWCEVRGHGTVRGQGSFALIRSLLQEFGYSAFDTPEFAAPRPAPGDEVLGSRKVFDLLFRAESAAAAEQVRDPRSVRAR
jgi:FkbM family methyltransferase